MIKLIASDIDGTLVPEGAHKLNPEYHNIIRELDDVGIKFCACSGRQFNSMLELFSSLESGKLTPEETLKEFVGHTGRQVIAGALVGIATALILNLILP